MVRVVDCHAGVLGSNPCGPRYFPLGITSKRIDFFYVHSQNINYNLVLCWLFLISKLINIYYANHFASKDSNVLLITKFGSLIISLVILVLILI